MPLRQLSLLLHATAPLHAAAPAAHPEFIARAESLLRNARQEDPNWPLVAPARKTKKK